jgi:DNA-binding MarR family transcriptional regulator
MRKDIHGSRENRRLKLLQTIGDVSRLNGQANELFGERIGEFLAINGTDGRCLDIISRIGRVSPGQLAIHSGLTTGAVTAVVDRLEAAGYVKRTRDPVDRRKLWVEPTPHINELLETIFGVYDTIGPAMVSHFTDGQLEGILAYLRMNTIVAQMLADGLKENTQPTNDHAAQLAHARQFRRAIDALGPRLRADLDRLLPPLEKD